MRAPSLVIAAALIGAAAAAHAEPAWRGWVGATLLARGDARVAVVHEVSLTTFRITPYQVGEAWATAVDVAYGVTPRLTLGLSQSARALGTVDHGGGWCHSGYQHVCSGAYAGGLVDARWRVRDRGLAIAALGGLGVTGLGPLRPVVRMGVSLRAARGRWWALAEPAWQVSLGHRELGNRDVLIAPLWLGAGGHRFAAWLETGLRGQTVELGDKYEIPIVLGAAVQLGRARLGLEAGWPKLLGPQNTGNVRHGALWLAVDL